jgi:hypothetical protein
MNTLTMRTHSIPVDPQDQHLLEPQRGVQLGAPPALVSQQEEAYHASAELEPQKREEELQGQRPKSSKNA